MNKSSLLQILKDLFRKKESDYELDEELRFHLEMQTAANSAAGMPPDQARRKAILQLGGVPGIQEEIRSQRTGFWLEMLFRDSRYGIRMLLKTPGLSLVSLMTLILAIGTTTVLFSLFYTVMLRPLPYPEPHQLLSLSESNTSKSVEKSGVSAPNLLDWRQRSTVFKGMAAFYTMGRTLSLQNDSQVVLVSQVTSDFFPVFGIRPMLGRYFTEEETKRTIYNNANGVNATDPVVILSYRLWVRSFGSDPAIIGKTISLDRRDWKVVGVMPRSFAAPETGTLLWIPWGLRTDYTRDQHFAKAVARLKEGVTIIQAQSQLSGIVNQMAREYPETNQDWTVQIQSLHDSIAEDSANLLRVLLAAVALVLLIACANIAILQLSRFTARMHETSIRLALGASRSRLIRQFLLEAMLLAFAGGLLGFVAAYFCLSGIVKWQPDFPRVTELSMDRAVLTLSIAVTALSAILFGLVPAFLSVQKAKHPVVPEQNSRMTSGSSAHRLRNGLVIVEIALAIVLVSASMMLMRSFTNLRSVNPGFNAHNVLVLPIFLDTEKYGSGEKSRNYYNHLFESLKALPGVKSVGGATTLPGSNLGPDFQRPVWKQTDLPIDANKHHADVRMVTTDYFRTVGMSITGGRAFSKQDSADSVPVIMINDILAQKIWPREDPIGKQIVVDYSTSGTYPYQVVGILKSVRFYGPRSEPRPEIYFPHAQRPYLIMNIAVKTEQDPRLLIASVRETLHAIDPQKPAHNITPMEDLIDSTIRRDRYAMMLFSGFSFAALLLALLGIYGVVAFFVRQKFQEIGIRQALGASRKQIASWITSQGARLAMIGLLLGMIGTLGFGRVLSAILFRVSGWDPISCTVAAFLLIAVCAVACFLPVRRALKINPSIAVRYE